MTSVKKTLVLACAVSLLGLGAAYAQTDPNADAGRSGRQPHRLLPHLTPAPTPWPSR